ncbi:MAG: hypothetical protein B7Z55_14325 [Planctomycetales bacterium 12-60-4]|nr:MAG: hypothetical protein B7Z55_14325 [Planctomycetales bacterium 12-60-4]
MIADVRWWLVSACLLSTSVGCTTFGKGGSWAGGPPKQSEPPLEEGDDKWNFVGKEARGSRALEDEHDPFKPLVMSKQARDIERNLGYK